MAIKFMDNLKLLGTRDFHHVKFVYVSLQRAPIKRFYMLDSIASLVNVIILKDKYYIFWIYGDRYIFILHNLKISKTTRPITTKYFVHEQFRVKSTYFWKYFRKPQKILNKLYVLQIVYGMCSHQCKRHIISEITCSVTCSKYDVDWNVDGRLQV